MCRPYTIQFITDKGANNNTNIDYPCDSMMSPINKVRAIEETRVVLHGDIEVEQDKGRADNSQTSKANDSSWTSMQVGAAMYVGVKLEKVVVIHVGMD